MRRLRAAFALLLPLSVSACGLLVGDTFDNLGPAAAGSTEDAAGADVRAGGDARPVDGQVDAADAGVDAETGAGGDIDAASETGAGEWTASATPFASSSIVFEPGGGLAALSRIDSVIDTFTVGYDQNVWSAGWRRSGWNPPYLEPLGAGAKGLFVAGGGVAAVAPDPSYINVYALGADGLLYDVARWHDEVWDPAGPKLVETSYEASVPVAFSPGGAIAAIGSDADDAIVLTIGLDGFLWIAGEEKAGTWDYPGVAVTGADRFKPGAGLAAIARDADHLETFAIGFDGLLWSAGSRENGVWSPAKPLVTAHFAPGAAVAATYMNGKIEVWTLANDGSLWNAGTWDGTAWQPGYRVPVPSEGVFSGCGGIGAAVRSDALEIYTIGFEHHLWTVSTRGVAGERGARRE